MFQSSKQFGIFISLFLLVSGFSKESFSGGPAQSLDKINRSKDSVSKAYLGLARQEQFVAQELPAEIDSSGGSPYHSEISQALDIKIRQAQNARIFLLKEQAKGKANSKKFKKLDEQIKARWMEEEALRFITFWFKSLPNPGPIDPQKQTPIGNFKVSQDQLKKIIKSYDPEMGGMILKKAVALARSMDFKELVRSKTLAENMRTEMRLFPDLSKELSKFSFGKFEPRSLLIFKSPLENPENPPPEDLKWDPNQPMVRDLENAVAISISKHALEKSRLLWEINEANTAQTIAKEPLTKAEEAEKALTTTRREQVKAESLKEADWITQAEAINTTIDHCLDNPKKRSKLKSFLRSLSYNGVPIGSDQILSSRLITELKNMKINNECSNEIINKIFETDFPQRSIHHLNKKLSNEKFNWAAKKAKENKDSLNRDFIEAEVRAANNSNLNEQVKKQDIRLKALKMIQDFVRPAHLIRDPGVALSPVEQEIEESLIALLQDPDLIREVVDLARVKSAIEQGVFVLAENKPADASSKSSDLILLPKKNQKPLRKLSLPETCTKQDLLSNSSQLARSINDIADRLKQTPPENLPPLNKSQLNESEVERQIDKLNKELNKSQGSKSETDFKDLEDQINHLSLSISKLPGSKNKILSPEELLKALILIKNLKENLLMKENWGSARNLLNAIKNLREVCAPSLNPEQKKQLDDAIKKHEGDLIEHNVIPDESNALNGSGKIRAFNPKPNSLSGKSLHKFDTRRPLGGRGSGDLPPITYLPQKFAEFPPQGPSLVLSRTRSPEKPSNVRSLTTNLSQKFAEFSHQTPSQVPSRKRSDSTQQDIDRRISMSNLLHTIRNNIRLDKQDTIRSTYSLLMNKLKTRIEKNLEQLKLRFPDALAHIESTKAGMSSTKDSVNDIDQLAKRVKELEPKTDLPDTFEGFTLLHHLINRFQHAAALENKKELTPEDRTTLKKILQESLDNDPYSLEELRMINGETPIR